MQDRLTQQLQSLPFSSSLPHDPASIFYNLENSHDQ